MTDEPREHYVRVNSTDHQLLETAQEHFEADVPLGYVARVGARKIIEDAEEDTEVSV